MAVICRVDRVTTLGEVGVTASEARVAAVTVNIVVPETPPHAAVMVADPVATAVATPLALTVATAALLELQLNSVVTF